VRPRAGVRGQSATRLPGVVLGQVENVPRSTLENGERMFIWSDSSGPKAALRSGGRSISRLDKIEADGGVYALAEDRPPRCGISTSRRLTNVAMEDAAIGDYPLRSSDSPADAYCAPPTSSPC
jgi:hypothetical protein